MIVNFLRWLYGPCPETYRECSCRWWKGHSRNCQGGGQTWIKITSMLSLMTFFVGCGGGQEKKIKIENIDRIFMHEACKFSFLVDGRMETHVSQDISFVYDAKEKPWTELELISFGDLGGPRWMCYKMVIHLHSPKDINGAGWNHGKFGQGQTEVIE